MLQLLLGKDWVANRNEILRQMTEDIHAGKGNRVLIVPELISHDTERRLCAAAGDTTSRYAEVLSFTRLAKRVSEQIGHAAKECLDNGGRLIAMASAARQLHSKLKAYASVETQPEFLMELLHGVDEFKHCCITSSDLKQASEMTQGMLAQKLEELSLLLETYDSICQQGKRDPSDQMTWLLEELVEGDFAQQHVFYIDGFPDFTNQHLAILEHLICACDDVTVSLNCTCADDSAIAFEKAGKTAAQLLRYAKRAGVPVRIHTVEADACVLQPLWERLFQGSTEQLPSLSNHLSVFRAESVYNECIGAAQKVLELVQKGCRYRDISVVGADMPAYRDIIQLVFHRCGIPLYLSGNEDVLQKSIVETVLSAMDAALGGFQFEDVLRYLKSVLSPLDCDTCDRLESYAKIWGVRGNKWHNKWINHPDGLVREWTDDALQRLQALNEARELAIAPLYHLFRGFQETKSVHEQIHVLYQFFEEIALAEKLDALAHTFDAKGDNRNAQILNQLWEILLGALEQMDDILGQTAWDTENFTRLFTLLLSQYDVGTIPPVLDAVMAGPVSAMRCQEVNHLIVLGATEGALPGYGGGTGVLTDQERNTLRELGVPLTGGNMDGLQAEFAEIYGVFCSARESVTVFCPTAQPSYVFRRLAEIVGGEKQFQPDMSAVCTDNLDAAAYLAAANAPEIADQLGISEEYLHICSHRDYMLGNVPPEQIRKLYGGHLKLSASKIDTHANCRLSYFLRYGLGLQELREATIDPAEFGTYVHAVLEETAKEVMELGGFHCVTLDKTMEIASKASDAYIQANFSQIESSRITYLLRRNVQELELIVQELWQELHMSAFEPAAFELAFGDDGLMPAIHIENSQIEAELRGFVDRVDKWCHNGNHYFRVVDYKTGKKDFDYCDVFNGLGLQMLLYLFALEQGGQSVLGQHPIGAGVQYFSARYPLIPADGRLSDEEAEIERGKKWKRKGLVLADTEILDAMEPDGAPKRLSCTRKKDGSISGDIASREDFAMLKVYILRLLRRMVDEIASGNILPNPYTRGSAHDACMYCPFKSICHPSSVAARRNYKAMNAQTFWEEVGKEMEHG